MKLQLLVLVSLAGLMAQTDSQQPAKQADSQTNAKSGASSATALPEAKTMTYKGVLVDMSCASHSANAAATSESGTAADSQKANSANRSASDSGSSCPVTANSTLLGMKLDDGKTVRFDLVGNQRAQDELKNNKNWNKELTAGKPIRAKADGVINGDKLIVSSIH